MLGGPSGMQEPRQSGGGKEQLAVAQWVTPLQPAAGEKWRTRNPGEWQHLVEISTKIKCGVLDPSDTVKMQKGNGPESSHSESFTPSSGFTCRRGVVHILVRKVKATNMFFSYWVLVLLAIGLIIEEWAELKLGPQKPMINQSPWICCTSLWPSDGLEVVRNILIVLFSLSFMHNLLLGFEFTYMIPQTKYTLIMTACLAFLTGILLLAVPLLYHHMLIQGESMYYSSYKVSWVIFTTYLNVLLFFASGFLSLLQCKQSINGSGSLITIPKSTRESQVVEKHGVSIKVVALPAGTAMPHSIVWIHSAHMKEDSPKRPHIQARDVTWAL
nr:PREDICTED: LOW QUALITY PROTEIN: transmembrane protein 225 [Bos mutus]